MSLVTTESNQHPNANGSRWLALAIILLPIIGNLITIFSGKVIYHPFLLISEISLYFGCIVMALVNAKNTFETNDPWKTWVGVAVTVLATFWPIGHLSATYNV